MRLKMSTFLTSTLLIIHFSNASAYQCRDIKVGQYRKTLWNESIRDGLNGELVNQLARKDDLFADISPEIEFDIGPYIEASFQTTRSVNDHLPPPKDNIISSNDLLTFKVNNSFQTEFKGKAEGGIFFAEGLAGLNLVHSTVRVPGKKISNCELLDIILDDDSERKKDFLDGACKTREKGKFAHFYDKVIKYLSQKTSNVLHKFFDSDKNKTFAEDPLAPLRIHSLLGVPIDHTIFHENNTDISVNDIIEHTTYYAIKPLGVAIDIFESIRPTYSRFRRVFRSVGYKKIKGNKVIVEIEDTQISGDTTEIFRIRPRILKIIKLNMGKWGIDDFKEESLTQKFEIDLNKESGIKFFKKILRSSYIPKLDLHKDSILIDFSNYVDALKVYEPIFRDGDGRDNLLDLKVPGVLDYQRRRYSDISTTFIKDDEFTSGEMLLRNRFRNKIGLDLWLFDIKKQDNKYECQMILENKLNTTHRQNHDASLNFICNYYNLYGTSEDFKDVADSLKMLFDDKFSDGDYQEITSLDLLNRKKISLFTQVSFPRDQIFKILQKSEEEIYAKLSELFFGKEAKNVFSKKYHKIWRTIRNDQFNRSHTFQRIFRKCSQLLYHYGINDKIDPLYDQFSGLIGRRKGIESFDAGRCYSYFHLSKKLVKSFTRMKEEMKKEAKIGKLLEIFQSLEKSTLSQALLISLSDGLGEDSVRFSYALTSPALPRELPNNNGKPYSAGVPKFRRGILNEINTEFYSRIKSVSYYVNKCLPTKMKINVETHFPINPKDLHFNFKLNTSSLGKEQNLLHKKLKLDNVVKIDDQTYEFAIDVGDVYDPAETYNVYLSMMNEKDIRVTKQTKSFVNRLLESEKEQFEED